MHTIHTPFCTGRESHLFTTQDRNRGVSDVRFDYLRCGHCGLIRLAHPPGNLGDYYPADYYDPPSPVKMATIAGQEQFKIDVVRRFSTPRRLLEIGPRFGAFAFQAKQAGYQVRAIEMDARCCTHLKEQLHIDAICSDKPHEVMPLLGRQDVIALWHVIEHLPDPWALVASAAQSLNPGGILVLATPSPQAWQFRIMGRAWPHLDAPRHLYLLPARVIIDHAAPLGLSCVLLENAGDARILNRFGWQRLLMNAVSGKWAERAAFLAGSSLSVILGPFDRRKAQGSAYTLVLRKAR